MTETVTENGEVAGYLAAIQEALADLPTKDFDDLIEDLEAHLYEVLAESGGASLESCLGSPAAYAAELRSSAGLEPASNLDLPVLRRLERRIATSPVWQGIGTIADQPWARAVRTFMPTLRPGWWVLRGWLALFAVLVYVHGSNLDPYRRRLIVPTYHGNWLLGAVAVLVAVLASVWLGAVTPTFPVWGRSAIGAGTVAVLFLTLTSYGEAESIASGNDSIFPAPMATPYIPPAYAGITVAGHRPLNIYPYDAQGHPLTGVRLYDEQGRPLQGLPGTDPSGGKLVRVLPSDAAGAVVANSYPQTVGHIPLDRLVPLLPHSRVLPSTGAAASSIYALATPMPTPTIFVAPMAGATPSPTPTTTPSVSTRPTTAKPTTSKPPVAKTKLSARP